MTNIAKQKTKEVSMKKVFHLEDVKLYQENDERKFEGQYVWQYGPPRRRCRFWSVFKKPG